MDLLTLRLYKLW